MSEKTHDPTPKKIEDARKKGQVPSSKDFAKCLIIWPVAEVAFAMEAGCRRSLAQLFDLSLRWNESNFQSLLLQTLPSSLFVLLLPAAVFALMVPLLATMGFWGQFGVLMAPESLTPDLKKLDPLGAAKNLFSPKKLKEIGLSLLKLALICTLSWLVVRSELAGMVSLAGSDVSHIYDSCVAVVHGLFRTLMGATLGFAVIDVFLQRHAHNKSLKMSLDEIIKEYKQSEGDPMIKGQRKQIAMEILNSDPVQATGTANAVVVNPTHFAVALFYKAGEVTVPMVCAKGHAETAKAMIARAQSLGIPVIRHVWLARTLFATGKAGRFVPAPTLSATALLFAVVDYMLECEASYLVLDESPLPPGAKAAGGRQTGQDGAVG